MRNRIKDKIKDSSECKPIVSKADSATILLGRQGELIAREYLVKEGYEIIVQNWRSGRYGELDLVGRDPEGVIVFVEVKTRRKDSCGVERSNLGFQAVDGLKQNKLIKLALGFLASQSLSLERTACRFDVIVVNKSASGNWLDNSLENSLKNPPNNNMDNSQENSQENSPDKSSKNSMDSFDVMHVKNAFHALSGWS
jgi:putative endonuclease